MSAPLKKRAVQNPARNKNNDDSDSSSDDGSDEAQDYTGQEQIQVDFEGRSPVDSDFHGIKQLLQQLFLKAHVNLSELADLIISQNHVGSVVKQSDDDPESDDEDEMDVDDVYGITTVINLTEKKDTECVTQLRTLLKEMCSKHATDRTVSRVTELLSDDSQSLGLILNERFVNIPPQIAVPLLSNLSKEIERAKSRKMPYNFRYFVLICKLHKTIPSKKLKKKKSKNVEPEPEILWSNAEEEVFNEAAECSFEFCVKDESDSGLGGKWHEDDTEMTPWRRVLLFPASKLDETIQKVTTMLQQPCKDETVYISSSSVNHYLIKIR